MKTKSGTEKKELPISGWVKDLSRGKKTFAEKQRTNKELKKELREKKNRRSASV